MLKGKFDFNTLHLKVEVFKSEVESLPIQKYPDACARCLTNYYVLIICQEALYDNLHDQRD